MRVALRTVATVSVLYATLLDAATFPVGSGTADAPDFNTADNVCDADPGAPVLCTLRAAIQQANALAGPDVIMLPAGMYKLTLAGRNEDAAATGDLDVTDQVLIMGAGSATTMIDGSQIDRVFDFLGTAGLATLEDVTVQNGNPGPAAGGGGIFNSATLTLARVTIRQNTTALGGGGIANDAIITIEDSVISGNTAASSGGGLDNTSMATLFRTTVSGNMAAAGAGVSNDMELTLMNVTISGNTASIFGGGISNNVTASLAGVTIASNAAPTSGGLTNGSEIELNRVLLAGGASGQNCGGSGELTSVASNLDSGTSCNLSGPGDISGIDPLLGMLADNGGPTPTHAPNPGSPAIDAGGSSCPPLTNDQRGVMRPRDGDENGIVACDIGAVEVIPTTTTTSTTGATTSSSSTSTTTMPLVCTVAADLPSIVCRLTRLRIDVETITDVPARVRLLRHAVKAQTQANNAQSTTRTRRKKALLAKTARSLAKFGKRLDARRVTDAVPADVLAALETAAAGIRQDVLTVRGSL